MENKNCIWNGVAVTEQEFWTKRLEQVLEQGCSKDALVDLKTDLDMNLEDDDTDWQLEECLNGRR